jgi:predicted DNA-binding transcriptional regulator AlpA
MQDEMLAEDDAAAVLGVTPRTMSLWRERKTGPRYVRMTQRIVRYSRSDLQAFIASKTVEPSDSRGAE